MLIRFPLHLAIPCKHRKPGKPMMGADLVVSQSVLPTAPPADHHPTVRIRIDHTMRPSGRNDYLFPNRGGDRDALSRIVGGELLCVHDRLSFPNLEQLRSGPSAMRRDGMNVSLASYWFGAQTPTGICDDAEKQHSPLELQAMLFASHIHHDRIDGVGTIALRITQTAADIIESPEIRFRTKNPPVIEES